MDKLKTVVLQLKKYHFWLLSLVVMIVGLYAWYSSAALLDSEKNSNIGEISKHKADVEAVSMMAEHPNDQVLEGIDAQTKDLQNEVLEVWSNLYQRQRKEVLFWPDQLTEEFIEYVDSRQFGDTIPVDLCEQYRDTIKERLKQLREIVDAKSSSKYDDEELVPGGQAAEGDVRKKRVEDEDFIVVWDNEGDVRAIIDWEEAPSPLKVWVAQEDLWVYEQLLKIIQETNKRATGSHDAFVTRIYAIQAGASAASLSGGGKRISVDESMAGVEEPTQARQPAPAPSAELTEEEIELLNNRYLDGEGKPIVAGQDTVVKEYKRMPVRFDLRMDQREISQLIVNCSNATLPVEVRQVRINPKGAGGGRKRRFNAGPDVVINDTVGRKEAMVRVEIHGIIYIFNPPDLKRLEIEPEPVQEQSGQAPTEDGVQAEAGSQDGPVTPEGTDKPLDPEPAEPPASPEKTPAEEPSPEPADKTDDSAEAPAEEPGVSPEKSGTPEDS